MVHFSSKQTAVLGVLVGLTAGLGAFTFSYGEGTSYLSDDPRACVNCHIMRDVYEGWLRSSHHAVATCNDCHVPHDFAGKWLSKARNGFNHSYAFTTGRFPEPIRITPRNAGLLEENCVACHATAVHNLTVMRAATPEGGDCVRCHRAVGHGPEGVVW